MSEIKNIQEIEIDFNESQHKSISVKQYDSKRYIRIYCYEDGKIVNINNDYTSLKALIRFITPDSKVYVIKDDEEYFNYESDGTLLIKIPQAVLSTPGVIKSEVCIYENPDTDDEYLTTMTFFIKVNECILDEILSVNDDKLDLISSILKRIKDLEDAIGALEDNVILLEVTNTKDDSYFMLDRSDINFYDTYTEEIRMISSITGDGILTATSSNPSAVKVSIDSSNNLIIRSTDGMTSGNSIVTVSLSETDAYTSYTIDINVSCHFSDYTKLDSSFRLRDSLLLTRDTLAGYSLELDPIVGDGVLSVSNSNPSVVESSFFGSHNLTVSPIDTGTTGTAIITVSISETAQYKALSKNLIVTCDMRKESDFIYYGLTETVINASDGKLKLGYIVNSSILGDGYVGQLNNQDPSVIKISFDYKPDNVFVYAEILDSASFMDDYVVNVEIGIAASSGYRPKSKIITLHCFNS